MLVDPSRSASSFPPIPSLVGVMVATVMDSMRLVDLFQMVATLS